MLTLTVKEKSILVGLFLSKFDAQALQLLGFESFTEAFNVIGFSLGVKPASLKNYRDEFDPYFVNARQGWHKRAMRQNCESIFRKYKELSLESFSKLIKEVVYKNHDIDVLLETFDGTSTFAKRLITGQAAEQYFKHNYQYIELFKDCFVEDTTKIGCGFDFKVIKPHGDYFGVEVKGLHDSSGTASLTNKEYLVANSLTENYILFVVKNFKDVPHHVMYQNPLNTSLTFLKSEKTVTLTTWVTTI